MSFRTVFLFVIAGFAVLFVLTIYDDAITKPLGIKTLCEVTQTTSRVETSPSGTKSDLYGGDMNCLGEQSTFTKPRQLPIGKQYWDKVAFGQKWQCDVYRSPIFFYKTYRNCKLL